MKLQNKVALLSIGFAIVVILGTAFFTDSWPGNGFCLMAGLIGMCSGTGYLLLGVLLLLMKDKRFARGFMFSGIALLIVGFITFKFLPGY